MKFAVALGKLFKGANESTLEFSKQIKALTFKEKEELHAMMVAEGHDVEPPTPSAA